MAETTRAIFLSYSSQDGDAVRRICAALRAAGLEVWFDQNELRGGDAWDASIRRQIRDCALFVPVISAHTEERGEGYFRLEWRLAVERSYLMADDQAFLMPVVIDDTSEVTARVPDRFRERQWTWLAAGETSQAFVDQVRHALAAAAARPAPTATPHPGAATAVPAPLRPWLIAAILTAVAAAVALTAGGLFHNGHKAVVPQTQQVATSTPAAGSTADAKSIAVLPFANLTGRPEDAYLADGLQEEILNALARLPDLKVISRTSAGEFRGGTPNVREVGQRLGVGSVLEGSVRREGQKLRLTVQLIDTRNDRHILAADYDRDLGHILGLQSEVARKVAAALAATLGSYERGELERVATNNGDAYNFYLRAAALWRQPTPEDDLGMVEPRRQLEQALRLDPDYTDALALLSQACTWLFFNLRHEADGDCAKKNYERALALDPRLPEARLARGLYEMYVALDLEQAFIDLDAVVRQRPNAAEAHNVLGLVLRRRSRFDEAITHFMRAWDLDPLNHAYDGGAFVTLMGLRRLPELIEQTRICAQRFPADPSCHITRGWIESLMQKNLEPVRRALREHGGALPAVDRKYEELELMRAEGRYLDAAQMLQSLPAQNQSIRQARLGLLYWAGGKPAEAERLFRSVESQVRSLLGREPHAQDARTRLALVQSMLGQHAAALATIDAQLAEMSEARDPVNGPAISFMRSIILVRAGRTNEGYAEVTRLLRVPFGAPIDIFSDDMGEILLLVKDDPHYDELIHHPPRL